MESRTPTVGRVGRITIQVTKARFPSFNSLACNDSSLGGFKLVACGPDPDVHSFPSGARSGDPFDAVSS